MIVQLRQLMRSPENWHEEMNRIYDGDTGWKGDGKKSKYLMDFYIAHGPDSTENLIDLVENIDGLLLQTCMTHGEGHLIRFEVQSEDWRQVKKLITKTLKPHENPPPVQKIDPLQDIHQSLLDLWVGYGLVKLIDQSKGGDLLQRITIIRSNIASETGVVVPPIRIRDNMNLGANQYIIRVNENPVGVGESFPGQILALDDENKLDFGVQIREPVFGLSSRWIMPEDQARAEALNVSVVSPSCMIATHIQEICKDNLPKLLSREGTYELIEQLQKRCPRLVKESIPRRVHLNEIHDVMKILLMWGWSIRNVEGIVEVASSFGHRANTEEVCNKFIESTQVKY